MREKPIPFNAPMVRAVLAGTKTQTRRPIKPVGRDGGFVLVEEDDGAYWPRRSDDGDSIMVTVREKGRDYLHEIPMDCPYGQPGDRLWVRESLGYCSEYGHYYAADRTFLCSVFDDPDKQTGYSYECGMRQTSVPSIHLPRKWSRITLEVTGVRVERLQDISEADAQAEGAPSADLASGRECIFPHQGTYRWGFRLLWEQINGPGSWEANPFVWVVEFRRLPTNQRESA